MNKKEAYYYWGRRTVWYVPRYDELVILNLPMRTGVTFMCWFPLVRRWSPKKAGWIKIGKF
jgi:hypothetical protein